MHNGLVSGTGGIYLIGSGCSASVLHPVYAMKVVNKKNWVKLVVFAGLVLWIIPWLGGTSGVFNLARIYYTNKALSQKIDSLTNLKVSLDKERSRLTSDTAYIERVIRSELIMAKPNEKVYRILDRPQGKAK